MEFDRKLEYQYGFFVGPKPGTELAKISRDSLLQLRKHFERLGGDAKLGDAVVEESLVLAGMQFVQTPTVTWKSGVWRVVLSLVRLDVYADALLFAQIAKGRLELEGVTQSVVPRLQAAAIDLAEIGLVAIRPVMAVTGEANLEPGVPAGLSIVAERFLSEEVREAVKKGEAWDVGARIDWGTTIDLGTERGVRIHRIESVHTQLSFTGITPTLLLRAQWDVNTTPGRGTQPFPPATFEAFFKAAQSWIVSKQRKLGIGVGK